MSIFKQIYYQVICSPKNLEVSIAEACENKLYKYIWGIINNHKCKLYRIYSMPDHIHIFSDLHPSIYLSDYVKNIKIASNLWMKESGKFPSFTGWQDARLNDKVGQGYGRLPILTRKKIWSLIMSKIKKNTTKQKHLLMNTNGCWKKTELNLMRYIYCEGILIQPFQGCGLDYSYAYPGFQPGLFTFNPSGFIHQSTQKDYNNSSF